MARPAHDLEIRMKPAVPAAFVTLVVMTTALLVAGLVSVAALSTSTNNSPADAVNAFLNAASTANVNGMLATVDPAERDAIAPALGNIVTDLEKAGVLDPSLNLDGIPGVGITFTGVTTRTTAVTGLSSDLADVVFTGGTAALHVDPTVLPLGTLIKGLLGTSSPPALNTTVPLAGPHAADHPITTIRDSNDGQWYVSLGYTVAENARMAAGQPLPTASTAVPAVGAGDADGVARALVTALSTGDLSRVIELTDPQDAAALHDYGGLLTKALPASPPHVTVTSFNLSDTPVDGGTLVSVTDFSAQVGQQTVALTPQGCLQFSDGTGASHQVCQPAGSTLLSGYGVVAVQRGSSWYLDPYRTVLDDLEHVVSGSNLSAVISLLKSTTPSGLLGGLIPTHASGSSGG